MGPTIIQILQILARGMTFQIVTKSLIHPQILIPSFETNKYFDH
jgi:hypothetical protein